MPMPQHVAQGQGQLKIDSTFTATLDGYKDSRLEAARQQFIRTLSSETGIPLHDDVTSTTSTLVVKTTGGSDAVQQLGEDESYHLEITADRAVISSPNPLGAMHGLQTFLQLVTISPDGFIAPAVTIAGFALFPSSTCPATPLRGL
jgi:hexosaminidase